MDENSGGEKREEYEVEKLIKNENKLNDTKRLLDKMKNDNREELKKIFEADMKKFTYLKSSLAKTTNEIEEEEEQLTQQEIQNVKKMNNLKDIRLGHEKNIKTIDEEIEATKAAVKEEEEKLKLMKENVRLNTAKVDEYTEDYSKLQTEIKNEFNDYEEQKHLETLVKMVQDELPNKYRKVFFMKLFRRFKEMKRLRQADFEQEKSEMEKVLSEMKEKAETLRKQVETQDKKYQSQCEFYKMVLKGKELVQRR